MCTVVTLRRPGHAWPLLLAANRDEMRGRTWSPPARHWVDRPATVAGKDQQAGGSWLGVNDHGVAVAILNRRGSLGTEAGKRSRGDLVLDALDHCSAESAAEALARYDGGEFRSFNMAIADREHGYWLRGLGDGAIEAFPLPEGVGMLTAWDLNDAEKSARSDFYLPKFQIAEPPEIEAGNWGDWQRLLESTETAPGENDPNGAMTVETPWGFGTVSRSMVALPETGQPKWWFSSLYPEETSFAPVSF